MKIAMLILYLLMSLCFSEGKDIGFIYGMLKKLDEKSGNVSILSDTSEIKTGNYLRINLGYLNSSNLYIIYKDAEDQYSMLFDSEDLDKSSQDTVFVTALYWTELMDPIGIETFYFINSYEAQADLVQLLDRYIKAPNKAKKKIANRLQAQIDSMDPGVKSDLASMQSRLDKPMLGGVAFRGDDDKIKDLSLTHSCNGVAGLAFKKILLKHQ